MTISKNINLIISTFIIRRGYTQSWCQTDLEYGSDKESQIYGQSGTRRCDPNIGLEPADPFKLLGDFCITRIFKEGMRILWRHTEIKGKTVS